jgi:fucose 4-O-acetylase-like acetyltransferase
MDRDRKIDTAKGIVIFLVVAGHVVTGLTAKIIFLFHMPFFFLVSGHLHKPSNDKIFYLKKKALSLLVPYFVYLTVFSAKPMAQLYFRSLQNNANDPSAGTTILKLIYGGELLKGELGIFWFITCLFLTQQLFNVCVCKVQNRGVNLLIAAVLYLLAFANQVVYPHIILPWGANIVGCSFLFYSIGFFYGDHIFKLLTSYVISFSVLISAAAIILILMDYNIGFNMKYTYFGWFIISPIVAVAFAKIFTVISYSLQQYSYLSRFIEFAGKGSITTMFIHYFLKIYMFPGMKNDFPWITTFAIFFICCVVHYIFTTSAVSRALFLGSRKDIDLLAKSCMRIGRNRWLSS